MKQPIFIVFLFYLLSVSSFAQRFVMLDTPHDSPAIRSIIFGEIDGQATDEYKQIKSLGDEYQQTVQIHFLPLKVEDIKKIFGAQREEHGKELGRISTDVVLPLFEPMMVGLSGLLVTNDRSHRILYSAGDIGYVEFFYHWDGETIGGVVFYPRPDNTFVPLETTNDIPRRLEWDKNKFEEFKQWVNKNMPKVIDLGEVEVSESNPKRIDLGANTACIITTREIHHPSVTNLWFEINVAKETLSPAERIKFGQRKSIDRPNQSVGFSIDGRFYQMTPKLVKQL